MNEMATRAVWAEASGVVCATWLCFVFGMTSQSSQFMVSMRKLTFLTIFAHAIFFEWSAQFCLVTRTIIAGCRIAAVARV